MFRKSVAWYLVLAMFLLAIVPRAEAGFVPTSAADLNGAQRNADLEKIRTFLEAKLVDQRLKDLGYSAEEVKQKLSLLSDEQLHSYAQQLDSLRAGGDGIGIVIGVLVIIILVIVILHLTGHKVLVT